MARTSIKRKNWLKKKNRTKRSLGPLGKYPRLVIFRSNKHIYGQLIDDNKSHTLLSSSTKDENLGDKLKNINGKIEKSKIVGYAIAEKIKKNKISKIVYDRNGYRYHGRVRALADAIREKGVNF
jgi:large subunit ribosomal protein L18|tara:strand:+ start:105 stop:476 length:372 start_codon:yes stop_codon:yes gene_type:complete